MTDHKHGANGAHSGPGRAPIDSEIDVRRTIEVGLWLGGTTIGALVVGYFIYLGLSKWATSQDPAASPLTEAARTVTPPAPNLQIAPEKELAAMRAVEQERLTTWGWTDKAAGFAHMPIEAAIDRLAVPEPPPASPTTAPASPPAAGEATPDAHAVPAGEAPPAAGHEGSAH